MTDLARSDAAADTGADRARPPRAIRRWVLLLVFAMGFGHAALYAVTFPPWAIEDEQQHVDYVWKIAHEGQLPTITDEIDYGIVEGIFGTDRFEAYGMARPQPTAESMGLQARSYAAYHPPAVYIALAPVAVVGGERALLTLYLLRFTSALAAGLVAVTTALLAVDLARLLRRDPSTRAEVAASGDATGGHTSPSGDRWPTAIALAAGIAIAALPALADSGGRVDTDIYATLIVVISTRLAIRWAGRPDPATSWLLGAVLAIAVLTRETALVAAIPVIVATASLVRAKLLDLPTAGRALAPPLVASFAWIGFQWNRSGYLDGSRAFLEEYGWTLTPREPRPFGETIGDAVLVPYGTWGVPWLLVVAIALVVAAGLALLARAGAPVLAATAAAMVGFVVLALVLAVDRDLNVTTARLLLPAYPAAIAAATVGWSTVRARGATFAVAIPVGLFGVWFAVFELLGRFTPRLG